LTIELKLIELHRHEGTIPCALARLGAVVDDCIRDERILPGGSRHVRIAIGCTGRKPGEDISDLNPSLRIKSDVFYGIHLFPAGTVEQLDPERIVSPSAKPALVRPRLVRVSEFCCSP
jgi:hypothetical protein